MSVPILEIDDLCLEPQRAAIGEAHRARGVTLRVCAGEVALVLGLYKEGQSRIAAAVAGFAPSHGQVSICGALAGSDQAKRMVGFVPAGPSLYQEMTCLQYLETFAELYDVERHYRPYILREALELVQLKGMEDTCIETINDEFKRRCLALARALVHNPRLVVVDEVLNGIDNLQLRTFVEILNNIRLCGKSLLLIGHQLGGLEDIVDQVCFMRHGEPFLQGYVKSIGSVIACHHLYQVQLNGNVNVRRCEKLFSTDKRILEYRVHPQNQQLLYVCFLGTPDEFAVVLSAIGQQFSVVSCSEDTVFFGTRVN